MMKNEIEADGYITPLSALEQKGSGTARPIADCPYPNCEECDNYHGHYCTVPMVVSKQIYRLTAEKLEQLEKRLTEVETLVTDEILGEKEQPEIDDRQITWEQMLP